MNIKKIILITLGFLFIVAAFEIVAYFFYIYKPASKIFGSSRSYPLEIPSVSQILSPAQITNGGMSLSDSQKIFYSKKLDTFKSMFESKIFYENSFIKNSSIDYIIGGKISLIKKSADGTINVKIKNSTNFTATETFSLDEIKNTKVFLYTFSSTVPSRSSISLENLLPEDYLIVKRSMNLLNKDSSYITEIEIFRTTN